MKKFITATPLPPLYGSREDYKDRNILGYSYYMGDKYRIISVISDYPIISQSSAGGGVSYFNHS